MAVDLEIGDVKFILDQAALNDLLNSSQGPVAKELLRLAAKVDAEAKQLLTNQMVNVRTGRLRSSTTHVLVTRRGSVAAIVGSGAKYGIYLHEGTRHISPRPYLTTAARNVGLKVR